MKKSLIFNLLFLAFPTFAADGLVTCGLGNGQYCTPCDLWTLASNIVDFLVKPPSGLAFPVLVLALLIGGVVWATSAGDPNRIELGKKIITSSIIGVFIAFGGWLIVDTIIKTLAEGKITAAWNTINKCEESITSPPSPITPPIKTPTPGTFQTEAEARAYFQNTDIEINKSQCTATKTTDCTDLKGLPISTAERLKALATSGGFCISGGTEGEGVIHQTHGVGKPIVDITPSCSGDFNIAELTGLRNRAAIQAKEAVCESQNGTLRSTNKSCVINSKGFTGAPFTASELKKLNHIHVVFP